MHGNHDLVIGWQRGLAQAAWALRFAVLLAALVCSPRVHGQALVAGWDSHNLVHFDLETGESSVYAELPEGSSPKTVAIGPEGNLYAPLRYHTQNIVKLVPKGNGAGFDLVDITSTIGRFGPAHMVFDPEGHLLVAADTERKVLRYNVSNGQLVDSFVRSGSGNVYGLAISGSTFYACEIFGGIIQAFDLSANPIVGTVVVNDPERFARPEGICVGHNGNLFVSNSQSPLIREYEPSPPEGIFVGNFIDLTTLGLGSSPNIQYSSQRDLYYIPKDNNLHEFDTEGNHVRTLSSPHLDGGRGVAFLDEAAIAPFIRSFTADRLETVAGETVVLQWETAYADALTIDAGVGDVSGQSSVEVRPEEPTTYTLSATNATGSRESSVAIQIIRPPVIESFTASRESVVAGASVTLSWRVTGADRVLLQPAIGDVPSTGSIDVRLEDSAIYRLQASNEAGTVVSTLELILLPPRLESVRLTSRDSVRIKVASGETLDIEYSTDLVHWEIFAQDVRTSLEVFRSGLGKAGYFRGVRRAMPEPVE